MENTHTDSSAGKRVAVITGGGSGIGWGAARHLASRGHPVALLDIDPDGVLGAAAQLREDGATAVAHTVDVVDRSSVDDALAQVRSTLGPVSIVVTSAGIQASAPFVDITADAWNRLLAVNLTGTFHSVQAAVPDMLAAGWGRIVTISSMSAQSGAPDRAHYAASKGGVIALTKALAYELAPRGITVNTIPPSIVDTPMAQKSVREGTLDLEAIAGMTPVRRAGTADDIGAACAFLCSDAGEYITGQVIGVNGGWYM